MHELVKDICNTYNIKKLLQVNEKKASKIRKV